MEVSIDVEAIIKFPVSLNHQTADILQFGIPPLTSMTSEEQGFSYTCKYNF